jgi:methanesulfonate monooxygenase small subunit
VNVRAEVEALLYQAALCLDGGDFPGFLERCTPDFRYTIGAYSPEIRRPMTWLDQDRAALQVLFETLPRHNSDHALLSRHLTVYTVTPQPGGDQVAAVSALQVFRTALDGGATELFAVGKIHDLVQMGSGRMRLARRQIRLDTRLLGIGSHIPF